MPPAQKRRKSLFLEALDIESPADREAFLSRACVGDDQLRSDIQSLLRAHSNPPTAIPRMENGIVATIDMPPVGEKPGTQIGPYKLLQQIGEGGFGVVYMAEQHKPVRRKVALKIIKPGMDTKEVIARFEVERQALALMDHPNIAKVLDAGATDSGRPYFVMELVKGVPITEFCDEQKLSTRERLQLFVGICRAIQHAHQKGIIHRDLKPSNVMVTLHDDKPVVKAIDFGISKALSQQLTEKSIYTAYGQMVGTPLYMSPEQAQLSGLDVDTRSDVYSLGVLLYELLTGATPFDKETLQNSGFEEMRRIICEVDPPRPSARISTLNAEAISTVSEKHKVDSRKLSQSLRGELDWIVMKAIEKDRNRRYESASAFAADVERYLNDEPVQARPASLWYLLRKFARKNRTAAVLTVMSLLMIAAVAVSGFVVAKQTRDKADRDRRLADKEIEINQKFSAAIAELQTAKDHAEQSGFDNERIWSAARQAAERAKTLAEHEFASPELKKQLQAALVALRDIERNRVLLAEFRRIRDTIGGEAAQGDTLLVPGKGKSPTVSDPGYYQALVDYGMIDPGKTSARILASRINAKPTAMRDAIIAGLDEWREYFRHKLRLLNETQTRRYHVVSHTLMLADDDPWRNKVRNTTKRTELIALARDPQFDRQRPPIQLLLAMRIIGGRQVPDGDLEQGLSLLRRAQRQHPQDYWLNEALADVLLNSNAWLLIAAKTANASPYSRRDAYRLLKKRIKPQPHEAIRFASIAAALRPDNPKALTRLAAALKAAGKADDAEAVLRRVISIKSNHKPAYLQLGSLLAQRGNAVGAVAIYKSALRAVPRKTGDTKVLRQLTRLLRDLKRTDEAIRLIKHELRKDPTSFDLYLVLGGAYTWQKRWKDAASAYQRAKDLLQQSPGWEMDWDARLWLAESLRRAGRKTEAVNAVRDIVKYVYKYGLFYVSNQRRKNLAENPPSVRRDRFDKLDEKSLSELQTLLNLLPNDAAARNVLGTLLFQQNDMTEEALAVFREAADADPNCFLAQYNIACTLVALNRDEEAIRHFEQALSLRPRCPAAWDDFGLALQRLGRHASAVHAFRQAIRFGFKSVPPSCELHLARSLRETGKIREAVEACYAHIRACDGTSQRIFRRDPHESLWEVKVIREAPGRAMGYVELRRVFTGPDAAFKAEEAIRNLIKSRPRDAEAYFALGSALVEQKKLKAAIESFRTATRLDPANARYFNRLGIALMQARRWKQAETALRRNIELRSDGGGPHINLGLMLRKLGRSGDALMSFEEGLKYNRGILQEHPETEQIRHNVFLSLVYLARELSTSSDSDLRDPSRAVTLATQATEMRPMDALGWIALGEACYRNGEYANCVAALSKAPRLKKTRGNAVKLRLLLAMASWRLRKVSLARKQYAFAEGLIKKGLRLDDDLRRLREEARKLLVAKED